VDDPTPADVLDLLAELDGPEDPEHPDIWIEHASGWSLSAFSSGLLIWENAEESAEGPRHMREAPRELIRELFCAVAADDVGIVSSQAWSPGYG
jgi:hypothetical protein